MSRASVVRIALLTDFTANFSHLHYNIISRVYEKQFRAIL